MKLDEFVLENWLNPAADSTKNKVYLGGSCVLPMTFEELFEVTGEDMNTFLEELKTMNLGYPFFSGTPRLRRAVAGLYRNVSPEDVVLVHGGTGANSTVVYTLIEPSDNVISIMPNYQQYYSLPRSIGAEVRTVNLTPETGYKLGLEQVRALADSNTKAIMLTNPNNPTGSLLEPEEMEELVSIAQSVDAWIVCDEMYRGMKEEYMPSMADIYAKAIVTCSSSKMFSMAGLRCGWIVCKDEALRQEIFNRRSYDSICGGVFDEWLFAIALEHADKILERSTSGLTVILTFTSTQTLTELPISSTMISMSRQRNSAMACWTAKEFLYATETVFICLILSACLCPMLNNWKRDLPL